ncbi:MAG: M48 family metallopeptidase [Sedimentisphaerales bacterium]|nr:M48 family metallopeptidase [Sedimentisphaerales bacterium]
MWELIRTNKRNSIVLLALMAVVLLLLGFIIGLSFFGPDAAFLGLIIATAVWVLLALISFSSGDQILLAASKARPVTHDVHPQLFNVVEEMSIAAGLPMPKVYIINDPAPNAFATGRKPQTASVAVTAGLLGRLNRDELQGVVAHEMSHILHRDILFVTMAGIMLGSIVLLSQVFLRGMFYSSMTGSRRRYSSGSSGGGQAQLIMLIVALLAAILAPIMAYLLYFALSRRREYLADAGGARLTRYPEGLAGALEKIANDRSPQLSVANKVTAPMYIANPFKKKGQRKLSDLTSTHPPISKRIEILRNMSQGASLNDYSQSFAKVLGQKTPVPKVALEHEQVNLRQPSDEAAKKERLEKQFHQIGDIMRIVNGFIFITCVCGLKLKIPPNYKHPSIRCPRCKRKIDIPKTKAKQSG